jgi:hypothetical protein
LSSWSVPLAIIGGLISTYHVMLERFPSLRERRVRGHHPVHADLGPPFGYLTIPAMALSAFALIGVLLLAAGADEPTSAWDAGVETEEDTEKLEAA